MMSAMRTILASLSLVASLLVATAAHAQPASAEGFLGRWNLTGTGDDSNAVFWLEVSRDDGKLTGRFLNRGGSPVPLASVDVKGNELDANVLVRLRPRKMVNISRPWITRNYVLLKLQLRYGAQIDHRV